MSLTAKALLFWAGLTVFLLLGNAQLSPKTLPLPANIRTFTVTRGERVFTLHKTGEKWTLAGQPVRQERMMAVLALLRACHDAQDDKQVHFPAASPIPLRLTINGQNLLFRAYNPLRQSHYLDDGAKSWFCDERLKAILAQPAESWLS